MRQDYSPKQVVSVLKKQGKPTVSAERIYQHVCEGKKASGTLYTHLRKQGRTYAEFKWECKLNFVFLGIFCRINPFKFSLEPLSKEPEFH